MDEPLSIREALAQGRKQLGSRSESAGLDTQVLLADALGKSKAWLLAHPEELLPHTVQKRFHNALRLLISGIPLPYVLGWWEFYGRRFMLTSDVLIPRPETEGLVEIALRFLDEKPGDCRVVDVGTGSGCIAISIAAEREHLQVIATDKSLSALRIARENAVVHEVDDRMDWVQCDLLEGLKVEADLVIANLPYIPTTRLADLTVARTEPLEALDGGELGMDLIQRIMRDLPDRLARRGMVLLEIDESHAQDVRALAKEVLPDAHVNLIPDLAGLDRYISIRRIIG